VLLRRASALACGIALAAIPGVARANDPAAAREHLKTGYELSKQDKCAEALPHLVESLRLDPKAITLINLANCEEKTGKLADATGHWADARARAREEGAKAIEEEAEKRATALEPRLPKLTIAIAKDAPPDTTVTRDGVALGAVSLGQPQPVNPGAHVIVVAAPGRLESKLDVTIAEAESKRVEVAPGGPRPLESKGGGDAPRAGGASPLVWIGFGTAGVGVAVGAITGLMALGKASSAKSACPDLGCPSQSALDDVDSGRTLGTISTIAFVVGGVGAIVGVYGLVAPRNKSDASVSVTLGPRGGALVGSF
jgi:hypothetical protein